MYTTILTLYKQGTSQRQIAKLTNTDRKTVKRIIDKYQNHNIEAPVPIHRQSKSSPYHEQIVELIGRKLSNIRIYEELQKLGYDGSYSSLGKYIKKHKIKLDTCIRFHSLAGQEAQVDFGDVGRRYDSYGKLRKAYVFNMRLSYSRCDYFEVVFDQKIETWIRCHINAFNHFAGVPEVIKLDNLKSGVIDPSFYEPIFQKDYKRFADHYGCLLTPCRVYQPQEKGKVESGIKYVKNNFFAGREFDDYTDMEKQLKEWNQKVNDRIHGTTKVKPIDLYNESERGALKPLVKEEFKMVDWQVRKVGKDCHIHLYNNYYSVPAKYAHENVEIAVDTNLVKIYTNNQSGNQLIATHIRESGKGIVVTNVSHYSKWSRQSPGFKEYDEKCEAKLKSIGQHSELMLEVLKKEQKQSWHRMARGIISLRKLYSDAEIEQACQRALSFGVNTYRKVKNILETNSHKLPLPGGSDANAS